MDIPPDYYLVDFHLFLVGLIYYIGKEVLI